MTIYYVTKETTCEHCNGNKIVQEPAWKSYWEWATEFKSENGRLPKADEDHDWWADCGYFYWEPAGAGGIPPEEIKCPDCGGIGVKVDKVDLFDALSELFPGHFWQA